MFVELADTLVDDFDVIDLLQTLAECSVEHLDADAAGLMLADHRGQLQVLASTSDEARVLELFELQSSEGPCLDCFTTGEPVVNVGLAEVGTRWPVFHGALAATGFRSVHALPMRLRGQIIGAMNLFCTRQSALSDDDIAVGQALCDVATIGLLQERMVRQGEVLAEQLQSALNTRIVIEQAKGALAERLSVSQDDAFTLMRQHARRSQQRLSDVAQGVITGSVDARDLRRR